MMKIGIELLLMVVHDHAAARLVMFISCLWLVKRATRNAAHLHIIRTR